MIVTAWNNGHHHESGAGYGLKVGVRDRDRFFQPEWDSVQLELEGRTIVINIGKQSFWGPTCRELISKEIGRWLRTRGYAPWPKGNPPKFVLEPLSAGRFALKHA